MAGPRRASSLLTDGQRDTLVAALLDSGIPHHLRVGLVRYLRDGILPGSFLQAVLCNDLVQTFGRGDPVALGRLLDLLAFLQVYAPPEAWGSREKVLAWTTTPDRLEV